jgi:hypothetical protein
MIESLYTVDFVASGVTRRLVSPGDVIDGEIIPKVSQGATRYASIGADWSERAADGQADSEVSFGVIVHHASHAALRSYCLRHAAGLPSGETGVQTLTAYSVVGSELSPLTAITLYAGIPWQWILQDWDDLTGDWIFL